MKSTPFSLRGLALLAHLLVVFSSVGLGQTTNKADEKIPLIQFRDVPYDVAIENLARQGEINYLKSVALPDRAISLRVENVSVRTVLTNLLRQERLYFVENPATTITLITTTNRIASPVDTKWIAAGTNYVIPLIHLSEVPLNVAFRELAKAAGHPIAVDFKNAVGVTISARWENVKARQAIAAVVEAYNLVIVPESTTGGIRINAKSR